jgi:erythromycin esterase-like protein
MVGEKKCILVLDAVVPPGNEEVRLLRADLYSLHASIEAVLGYLTKVDPEAANRARRHYSCFDHFGRSSETYG